MEKENKDLQEQLQEETTLEAAPELEETIPEAEEKPVYVPRPMWHRIAAWLGILLVIGVMIVSYINAMR